MRVIRDRDDIQWPTCLYSGFELPLAFQNVLKTVQLHFLSSLFLLSLLPLFFLLLPLPYSSFSSSCFSSFYSFSFSSPLFFHPSERLHNSSLSVKQFCFSLLGSLICKSICNHDRAVWTAVVFLSQVSGKKSESIPLQVILLLTLGSIPTSSSVRAVNGLGPLSLSQTADHSGLP